MKKIIFSDFTYNGHQLKNLQVFLDDDGIVLFLPLLFSVHLKMTQHVYRYVRLESDGVIESRLESSIISETSIETYLANLFRFLKYINTSYASKILPNVHRPYVLATSDINEYLNHVLPLSVSDKSLDIHRVSLTAFFNFLSYLKLRPPHKLFISAEARKVARDNNGRKLKINYISLSDRFMLLSECTSIRDRLIMKLGYEVGLRAAENRGLLLSRNGIEKGYLLELFSQLALPRFQHKEEFSYYLPGKYAKRGVGRYIFFSRELLRLMKDYVFSERASIVLNMERRTEVEHLLINHSGTNAGMSISHRFASDRFRIYAKALQYENEYSYHDLRHTFATELYYDELRDANGAETRSESAALIVVAERLGHQRGKNGLPSSVTTRYIRLKSRMMEIEGGNNE